ncbi:MULTISPECIES: ABC transporter ATP-binding protein [unclassified Paenibacillus]|uniref:ABC transporter ATP-binding protein n=1 Tax=unclassified Paenibacillus TaxID=185978 RepID=UPI00104F6AD2|nr:MULTISPECIES: ABC transporter ATP-binding protein [unclassified Paenibacillus]NIK69071.1 putative ABC transport system ATP-binding protein [Paenibacillus sp. BK720]TCM89075.1 putative ABC transport system ATP-binding protein [Paenibacillus sp. BK033]
MAVQLIQPGGPLLEVHGVYKSFISGGSPLQVLKGIDLAIESGKLTMLRGRSGSGKTTLLNLLGGLDQPSEGEVLFRGRSFRNQSDKQLTMLRRRQIGFVFQSFALLPLFSAWENVELSLRMAGARRSEWKPRTARCLELVGLTKRANHRPSELSGGEQQRIAIAKAIAHKPALLLADEPTAELDSQMAAKIIAIFRDIIEAEGIAICMTTHDSTLWEAADVVYQMADGRLQEPE